MHKQQGVLICSLCDNESHATIKCIDCDESLCQDCWFCQESNHVDHEVDILNNQTATEAVPKCARHPDLDYCFYCQNLPGSAMRHVRSDKTQELETHAR